MRPLLLTGRAIPRVSLAACFYLGTLVNEHYQQQQQHDYLVGTASLPPLQAPAASPVGARSEPSEAAAPAPTSRRLSTVDELALLEGRLKRCADGPPS